MPLDGRSLLQLGLLLLAVPAQFFIANYMRTENEDRNSALKRLITSAEGFRDHYLTWHSWQKWCVDLAYQITTSSGVEDVADVEDEVGESPAREVLKYQNPDEHFAASLDPRSPRAASVKYRIGQVIRHKKWGYRGVIVGWDPVAKAPESWLKQMHPPNKPQWRQQPNYSILVDTRDRNDAQSTYVVEENLEILTEQTHWRSRPNYSVLVDTRDRQEPQTTYVAEENIQLSNHVQVIHPKVNDYFEAFDGSQYIARPWLKKIYPHD